MIALRAPSIDRIPVSVHPTTATAAGAWEARVACREGLGIAASGRTAWSAVRALAARAQVGVDDLTLAVDSPEQLRALAGCRVRPEGSPSSILKRQASWWQGGMPGVRVDLCHRDWRGATLPDVVDLTEAYAAGLALRHRGSLVADGAYLADAVLRECRLVEFSAVGACLAGVSLATARLNGARLRGVDAERIDLTRAGLVGADLHAADLTGAVLVGADATGVDFTRACLHGAVLGDACLRGARLRGADLTDVSLAGADLLGADFASAELSGVVVANAMNVPVELVRAVVAAHAVAIGDADASSATQLVDRLRRNGLQAVRQRATHLHPERLVISTGYTAFPIVEVADVPTAHAIATHLIRRGSTQGEG